MRIEVLTFGGCPHADEALALVRDVAAALVPEATVAHVRVETPETAARERFRGSPSVRIDGADIDGADIDGADGAGRSGPAGGAAAAGEDDRPALSCRLYRDGDATTGVPPRWLVEAAVLRALRPRGVLFLCVANSARSQLAEGIARSLAAPDVRVFSAGSEPSRVRPQAVRVLAEIGIDASGQRSKGMDAVPRAEIDTVVTLCAEEVCPAWFGCAHRVHWGLPDPAGVEGDDERQLDAFRQTRDELRRRLGALFRGSGGGEGGENG
jgi:arsenate reductase